MNPTMPFFESAQEALDDILSIWQRKHPSAHPLFTIQNSLIRFHFTRADTLVSSSESKWFVEEDVWQLDVDLEEIDREAERLLEELYSKPFVN